MSHPNRHYEERELRAQQERARRRMEFDNLRHKLENQLECERSQVRNGKVWKASIQVLINLLLFFLMENHIFSDLRIPIKYGRKLI